MVNIIETPHSSMQCFSTVEQGKYTRNPACLLLNAILEHVCSHKPKQVSPPARWRFWLCEFGFSVTMCTISKAENINSSRVCRRESQFLYGERCETRFSSAFYLSSHIPPKCEPRMKQQWRFSHASRIRITGWLTRSGLSPLVEHILRERMLYSK